MIILEVELLSCAGRMGHNNLAFRNRERTIIAQFCGWTDIFRKNSGAYGGLQGIKPGCDYFQIVPSYFTSLDAMHSAEPYLNKRGLYRHYIQNLHIVLGYKRITPEEAAANWDIIINHIRATAAQRAEAFIVTINNYEKAGS